MILDAQAAGTPYDLALIDYQMPVMNGEELAEKIRGNAALESTALILLTSINSKADTGYFLKKRINARLTKPIKATELLETIEWVLGDHGLEAAAESQNGSAGPATQVSDACFRYRVLLAEDNAINQELICEILNRAGISVELAEDGEQAIAVYHQNNNIALILMDCQMPVMSGFDATAQIRQSETSGRRVPIIALTANAMKGDRERCLDVGMDDYLTKPIDPELLIDRIFHWIAVTRDRDTETKRGRKPAAQNERAMGEAGTPAGTGKILLVEDDDILGEFGVEILEAAGFDVDLAMDGEQAIVHARQTAYDVILMDGNMPRMDGFTATKEIRKLGGRNARVPVIAVTGSIGANLPERMQEAGMNDYILKPYNLEQLVQKINTWLAKVRQADQQESQSRGPAFDFEKLVSRCMGNQDLARRLLGKFNQQIEDDLARLRQALAAGETTESAQAAHKIKGVTANLTLETIRNLVEALELAVRSGELNDGARYLAEIERAVSEAKNDIGLFCSNGPDD